MRNNLPVIAKAAKMVGGDVLPLEETCVKRQQTLTFTGNLETLEKLIFWHGRKGYASGYVTLDNEKIRVYAVTETRDITLEENHGLTLSGPVTAVFAVDDQENLSILLSANGSEYRKDLVQWFTCRGAMELESVDSVLTDVTLSWTTDQYDKSIWVFGDSYTGPYSARVWPYYVLEAGYDTCLYCGYPGAGSKKMYEDWQVELTHGTPKYAVWCLGMNNGDSGEAIHGVWKTCADNFLADCKARGITPVLATIPNTPVINNNFKNDYVRNSGCRYIDFASAVNVVERGNQWHEGMIRDDNVHPTPSGAKALAEQFMKDMPEIKE